MVDDVAAVANGRRGNGAIAQLVEHLHGMQGVRSSSLLGSIKKAQARPGFFGIWRRPSSRSPATEPFHSVGGPQARC